MVNVRQSWKERMQAMEIGMLQHLSCVSRKDRIRNDYIRGSVRVADIRDKMREHGLQWFDHMMRWVEEDLVGAILGLRVEYMEQG